MGFYTVEVNGRQIQVSGRDETEARHKAQHKYHYGCDTDERRNPNDCKADDGNWSQDEVRCWANSGVGQTYRREIF